MAALSAVKNQKSQKTRQKIKVMQQQMRLFFRQGIEGLAVRCQKGEGGIAVKNILYLTSEVAWAKVFPLHQVELLIAVLREGGVRLEDKEVFKRKLFPWISIKCESPMGRWNAC